MDSNSIRYSQQYKFKDLKYINHLKFDFAVLDDNQNLQYLIEFNGLQHYNFKSKFHKNQENFIINQHRDLLKVNYCIDNKIDLYIIKFDDDINSKMNEILQTHHANFKSF